MLYIGFIYAQVSSNRFFPCGVSQKKVEGSYFAKVGNHLNNLHKNIMFSYDDFVY